MQEGNEGQRRPVRLGDMQRVHGLVGGKARAEWNRGGLLPASILLLCVLLKCLAEKLQHALGQLIGLGQHGLCGLVEDGVLCKGHHFLGYISIADG